VYNREIFTAIAMTMMLMTLLMLLVMVVLLKMTMMIMFIIVVIIFVIIAIVFIFVIDKDAVYDHHIYDDAEHNFDHDVLMVTLFVIESSQS
jgi:membrane protein YdbS with pleckstrin-like domain